MGIKPYISAALWKMHLLIAGGRGWARANRYGIFAHKAFLLAPDQTGILFLPNLAKRQNE